MKNLVIFKVLIVCILLLTVITFSSSANNIKLSRQIIEKKICKPISNGGSNCAVIVCGADNDESNIFAFIRDSEGAKDIFKNKGWNVNYLFQPCKDTLNNAIVNWIPSNIGREAQVLIYIVCNGIQEGFLLLNFQSLNNKNQRLYPIDLKNMVDNIKEHYSLCTIVLEASYSGIFIPSLSGEKRIIITSTDHDSRAYVHHYDGLESLFSQTFFPEISKGKSYGEAWELADDWVEDLKFGWPNDQNPQIEDSGNGVSVGDNRKNILPITDSEGEEDGLIALNNKPPSRCRGINSKTLNQLIFEILSQRFRFLNI